MTPTQIARRSDALYADGTCGMTRRVLCDMVAQRESDLEDARAENAKLRELVRNLRRVIPADVVGVVIGANTDHPTYYRFDDVFRELGIEVDG